MLQASQNKVELCPLVLGLWIAEQQVMHKRDDSHIMRLFSVMSALQGEACCLESEMLRIRRRWLEQ